MWAWRHNVEKAYVMVMMTQVPSSRIIWNEASNFERLVSVLTVHSVTKQP